MNNLLIDKKSLDILIDIFNNFCPKSEVLAYGSRINGRGHEGSDLDLAIKNFPKDKHLYELREILSESNVLFLVDVNIYENLPTSFKEEIDRNNIKLFPRG